MEGEFFSDLEPDLPLKRVKTGEKRVFNKVFFLISASREVSDLLGEASSNSSARFRDRRRLLGVTGASLVLTTLGVCGASD